MVQTDLKATVSSPHRYLSIAKYHLSAAKAETLVLRLLKTTFPNVPRGDWKKGKDFKGKSYADSVMEARKTGTVAHLRGALDMRDPIFGGTLGFSMNVANMKFKMEYAGYSCELTGPQRQSPIERELTDDILWARVRSCETSGDEEFARTARYYRAYVFACTALVEAFLNRHVLLAKHLKTREAAVLDEINSQNRFKKRLKLWTSTFTHGDFTTDIAPSRNSSASRLKPSLGFRRDADDSYW